MVSVMFLVVDIMSLEIAVSELININYNLKVEKVTKVKNVYQVSTKSGRYCLKVIPYDYGHFLFIIAAMEHLMNNGFKNIPEIIPTLSQKKYVKLGESYAYLTKWVDSRLCNYSNPIDIIAAVAVLADLHLKSRGFSLTEEMNPRIGWFKWIQNFETRRDEILKFRNIILNKDKNTDFDSIYLDIMQAELPIAQKAINDLGDSEYIIKMQEESAYRGFCHHDYAHHNVLINEKREVNIIDFDYCILDTHLHDLSSVLIRKMKNGKWEIRTSIFIMDVYDSIYKINNTDIPIMAAFMEFPQDYWQIGLQYYVEKQPWEEEEFISRLKRIREDIDEKQEFIDEFMNLKYKK